MVRAQKRKKEAKDSPDAKNNGANLGFEAKLWATADKLRGNMEPSDYKHVVLGLIFLKYISDAFEAKRGALLKEELADAEDPEEYLASNVLANRSAVARPMPMAPPVIKATLSFSLIVIRFKRYL